MEYAMKNNMKYFQNVSPTISAVAAFAFFAVCGCWALEMRMPLALNLL
jgi:hypothetical protein